MSPYSFFHFDTNSCWISSGALRSSSRFEITQGANPVPLAGLPPRIFTQFDRSQTGAGSSFWACFLDADHASKAARKLSGVLRASSFTWSSVTPLASAASCRNGLNPETEMMSRNSRKNLSSRLSFWVAFSAFPGTTGSSVCSGKMLPISPAGMTRRGSSSFSMASSTSNPSGNSLALYLITVFLHMMSSYKCHGESFFPPPLDLSPRSAHCHAWDDSRLFSISLIGMYSNDVEPSLSLQTAYAPIIFPGSSSMHGTCLRSRLSPYWIENSSFSLTTWA